MKNLASMTLALFLSSCTLLGQGTIRFNTRIPSQVDAPVSAGMQGAGSVPGGAMAQLYLITATGAPVPLFPATTFQTSSPAAMFYVNEPTEAVTVPGAPAGSTVNIQLRVWVGGATYETATSAIGESNIIPITLGGVLPDGSNLSPAVIVGLEGFVMFIPMLSWFDSIIVRQNHISIDAECHSQPGSPWVLESSTDFQSWQPISTNSMRGNTIFEVPHSAAERTRIFRLRASSPFEALQ